MGKHRFRFSDMLPNAWFYKLKDMSKTRTQQHYNKKQPTTPPPPPPPHISLPRYSYNFTTEPTKPDRKFYNSPVNQRLFPNPSRKSSKKNSKRKTIYKPSPRHFSNCNCHQNFSPFRSPDCFISSTESSVNVDFAESADLCDSQDVKFAVADSRDCEAISSNSDIIIDLNNDQKLSGLDTISELELSPIRTKPSKFQAEVTKFRTSSSAYRAVPVKIVKEETSRIQKENRTSPVIRKSSSKHSPGIRLRAYSPRIASKKLQAYSRKSTSSNSCSKSNNKSISESFVVVKSSFDPQRDFRESMVEMIVENNLRGSKDLEDLLACYLLLNSNEYHELIVKAFEQVWFHMSNLRL